MMKNERSKVQVVLISVLLTIALLVGCAPTPTATVEPVMPTSTAIPPTPTVETPQVGGTLRYLQPQEPATLDQSIASGDLGSNIVRLLGSSLLDLDPTTGQLVGYLAESWQSSPDGLVWTFTLKKGVKFTNGDPMTAHDFVYTLDRAGTLKGGFLKGQIVSLLAKWEAPDDYTLVLTLKKASFSFITLMATPNMQPLSQRAVEAAGADYGRHPVGVGPYAFNSWIPGQKVVLERNPAFNWGPAYAHSGATYIAKIEFLIIADSTIVNASLQAGQMDIANINPTDVASMQANPDFSLHQSLSTGLSPYVGFNFTLPPFDDVRVRKAMSIGIDRKSLIQVVALGMANVQLGPLSPAMTGYWPGAETYGVDNDKAQALSLLKDAGYTPNAAGILEKGGVPLKFTLKFDAGDAISVNTAQVLQQQYKALGIDLELVQMEFGQLYGDLQAKKFDLFIFGMSYPNADLLGVMFRSTGGMNLGGYNNPDYDNLIIKLKGSLTLEDYQAAAQEAQKFVIDQALCVPLFAAKESIVYSNRIKGLNFYQVGTDARFSPILFDAWLVP